MTITLRFCEKDIARAAQLLQAGELVAIPTETVYGLAANALDAAAVAKIFAAKGRPQDNPLIVHIDHIEQARALARAFPPAAQQLAQAFWPGPLTIILPKAGCVPDITTAGLSNVALRMPAHPAALALLRACGLPLAAPSANRSGSPSPTSAQHVLHDLDGRIAAVLDGGSCGIGVESTVISLAGEQPILLRPGGISAEQIEAVLGQEVAISPAVTQALGEHESPASPGMKHRHYAPRAKLTLVRGPLAGFLKHAELEQPDGLLVFDGDEIPGDYAVLRYGANAEQQARQLFARLREIDALGLQSVLVRCPEQDGLGLAVYNRLLRAANFREIIPNCVIGLTGMTGAGKSTAANILARLGCHVIDGDDIAREITRPGTPVLTQLALRFGSDVLNEDGSLNRALLAARAFESDAARRDLNAITHPAIAARALEQAAGAGERPVVIDAAALLESELARHCGHIFVITAPEEIRLARIVRRDGISMQAAKQRIAAQAHMDYTGHTIIENTEGEAALAQKLEALLAQVCPLGGGAGAGAGDHVDDTAPA